MASILHDLGIEPGVLVVNITGFVILLWLMRRIMFKPVGAFIEQRKRKISDDLDAAEESREAAARELDEVRARREGLVKQAEESAADLARQAQSKADETLRLAREQSRDTERNARAAIDRDREQAAVELRDQVSDTSVRMCRTVLRQALNEQRHRALIDEFIADVERLAAERHDG